MNIAKLIKGGLRTVAGVATGGISEGIFNIAEEIFGDDMTLEQSASLKAKAMDFQREKEREANLAADQAEQNVTERASQLEGTAKDLLALPFVGRFVIFARGCQRPAWGFFTMYLDYKWLTGGLQPAGENITVADDQMGVMLIVINFLVLGFLFGERAVKNLMPLIMQVFAVKMKPNTQS